jgi:hypothetical protein
VREGLKRGVRAAKENDMAKKRLMPVPGGLVPHPRFVPRPNLARARIPEAEIRAGFWRLRGAEIFPESAIAADVTRQNYALFPRRYYVDMLKQCWQCARPFIFFAREQQFWFETLGFNVDADAVDCTECRHRAHVQRATLARHAAAMHEPALSDKALLALVDDAADLADAGLLKRVERLGALKNRALRQCGENARIARLAAAIERLRAASSPGHVAS